MWQKGHLRAQSCFSWSMTCISAEKKKAGKKTLFSAKGEARPDSLYGNLSEIVALDIFTLRGRLLYHLRSRWWVSQLTPVVFKKKRGEKRGGAHTRAFVSLGSHWPSPHRLPPRTAVFYLAGAATLQSYQRGNLRGMSNSFSNISGVDLTISFPAPNDAARYVYRPWKIPFFDTFGQVSSGEVWLEGDHVGDMENI